MQFLQKRLNPIQSQRLRHVFSRFDRCVCEFSEKLRFVGLDKELEVALEHEFFTEVEFESVVETPVQVSDCLEIRDGGVGVETRVEPERGKKPG